MIFALVLLYQTATAVAPANSPKADAAQAQTQTLGASGDTVTKPPEKPAVVCHKEFPTGTRVRTVMVCTSKESMERSQADFSKSLRGGSLTPIP